MKLSTVTLIAIFSVLIYSANSHAGDCFTKQLPDGSYTTECPSDMPPPPSPPQGQYIAACETELGACSVTFDQYVPTGTACYCMANDGNRIGGAVNNR